MLDYICFERIWQDDTFFQLGIECASRSIIARSCSYTSNESIAVLISKLNAFLDGTTSSFYWINGEKGNLTTPCFSLEFCKKDNKGHIQVEVYLELDDGGPLETHNCCFYVNTEFGALSSFLEDVTELMKPQIGKKVFLNKQV